MSSDESEVDDSIFNLEYADAVPVLSKAARMGNLSIVRELIMNGSLPQAPDNKGWTAIHHCVLANQLDVLKLILKLKSKTKKYLVNLLNWENESPLFIALKSSQPSIDMVTLLLESGADPNVCGYSGITPLHLACKQYGGLEIVKLLVQYGANISSPESIREKTPLHFAISEARDLDIIKYLVNVCDFNLMNDGEQCPFLEACSTNFMEAVEVFIKRDKKFVHLKSTKPPLVHACIWGNIEMAKLLVNSGADVHGLCKAVISSKQGFSNFYFDRKEFFPIHSSFHSMEVYKYLLTITQPERLLELENMYYSFPLFVLLFGSSIEFYETLLQSDLPLELKTINCRVLVNFALSYPLDLDYFILKSFPLLFKYNFNFEPENVFQTFVCELSSEEVCSHFKVFHMLAQMGISSENELENKKTIINIFQDFTAKNDTFAYLNVYKSVCDLLSESVLTLKQYSRIAARRKIKSDVNDDWLAYKMICESGLPEGLKKFLLFDKLN